MTSTDEIAAWVEAYRQAWISNDPDDVARLFTDDAVYEFRPHDPEPWRGRDAIASGWLEEQDSPETWEFEFEVLGTLDDGSALVRAVTKYLDDRPTYDNLWFVTLEGGKASRFTEWYMAREGTGTDE